MLPFRLFILAKLAKFAFGLYFFYLLVRFIPLLKHVVLLTEQVYVCKNMIISHFPYFLQQNNARWVWEVVNFIEGVPSNEYITSGPTYFW